MAETIEYCRTFIIEKTMLSVSLSLLMGKMCVSVADILFLLQSQIDDFNILLNCIFERS